MDHFVFDFDGVFTESKLYYFDFFKEAARHFGIDFPFSDENEFARHFVEPVWPDFYRKLGFDTSQEQEIVDFYKEYDVSLQPVHGLKDLLADVTARNHLVAIASNNSASLIEDYLQEWNMCDYISGIITPSAVRSGKSKPEPAVVYYAFDHLSSLFGESARKVSVFDQKSDMVATSYAENILGHPVEYVATSWGMGSDFANVPLPYENSEYHVTAKVANDIDDLRTILLGK